MPHSFDIAIAGSGFSGSLLSMIVRRLGRSVVLLEKASHPRFVIGESATPLANLLLEELATRYDLPRLLPLSKWGTWQRTYPGVACGLKRGFSFYHHSFEKAFQRDSKRQNQLLVAASPHDEIADTHWYRADLDHFLVREAQTLGVEFVDRVEIKEVIPVNNEMELHTESAGKKETIRCRFLVDATGPRGLLSRMFDLPERTSGMMPPTQGLYTHFRDVRRLSDLDIDASNEVPPYNIDDSAVHHIFDGGWIWVLRFNNGITSAGVAAIDSVANELRFSEGAAAWERLLQRLPTVKAQFVEAKPQRSFVYQPRLSFHSQVIAGKNWALLPSAAGFVDPLLSTGFPFTLLGIARLAEIFEKESWKVSEKLHAYAEETHRELMATESLVAALYANMNDFSLFISLSMLYFAAASFAETVRRLGRSHLAASFLLADHPEFEPRFNRILRKAMDRLTDEEKIELINEIRECIEPVNVAGLMNEDRRNWYPVEASDLLNSGAKVDASREEIHQLLIRSGFVLKTD